MLNACRNPHSYWKIIKQNCNGKSPLKDYISPDDWVRYFQNLLNMDVDFEIEHILQNITQDHDCNELDRPISNEEIISNVIIKSINSNRSPGPDGICIEIIPTSLTSYILIGCLKDFILR